MFFQKSLNRNSILLAFEEMGHPERIKQISKLVREHPNPAEIEALLSSLLDHTAYEAQLALIGIAITKNRALLFKALQHSQAGVRVSAACLLSSIASVDEIERELDELSFACRKKVLVNIVKDRNQTYADRLLPFVYERWGAIEATILLSACGSEMVNHWIERLGYTVQNWSILSRRHLDVVARYFMQELKQAPTRERLQIWESFASAMEELCRHRADMILECVLTHGPHNEIPYPICRYFGLLIDHSPNQAFELLTRPTSRKDLYTNGIPNVAWKRRNRFSKQQWIEIAKIIAQNVEHDPYYLATVFAKSAPSFRAELYEAVFPSETRQTRIIAESIMRTLPHQLRDQEAKRILGLRSIQEDREKTKRYMAFRWIHDVKEQMKAFASVSKAEERAEALANLLTCSALCREGMDETLTYLTRIKNDQDPVRFRVMEALARNPISRYSDNHVQVLSMLVSYVMEARDTSYGTLHETECLAFEIIQFHAKQPQSLIFEFALETIEKIARKNGNMRFPILDRLVPSGIEYHLTEALYPLLTEFLKRENTDLFFSFLRALGKRANRIQKLQELLEKVTQFKSEYHAKQAIHFWLKPIQTRDQRVKKLLKSDPSTIAVEAVANHLHHKRQEWLNPYLEEKAISGRFLSGKTIYLLPFKNGFQRWLPKQQKMFGKLLERVITDTKRSMRDRVIAIRTFANMPDASYDQLRTFLKSDQTEIVEATLLGLSHTQHAQQALEDLVKHLESDRARVAMYSVARCIRHLQAKYYLPVLEELLNRNQLKITVHKEAIRLLGEFKGKENIALIQKEYGKKPHRDVLIAIGHATRSNLADERAWGLLNELVVNAQTEVVYSLLEQSPDVISPANRARYLDVIIQLSKHADSHVSQKAYRSMIGWSREAEVRIAQECSSAICILGENKNWFAAAQTLLALVKDGRVDAIVTDIVQRLARSDHEDEWDARSQRDLPYRQRLYQLMDQLIGMSYEIRIERKPLFQELIERIQEYDSLQHLRVKCELAILDWGAQEEVLSTIQRIVEIGKQYPYATKDLTQRFMAKLEKNKAYWKFDSLLDIIDHLIKESDEAYHQLAFSGLCVLGRLSHWPADCIERLLAFRKHPQVTIRALARDTFVVKE